MDRNSSFIAKEESKRWVDAWVKILKKEVRELLILISPWHDVT